MENFEVKKYVLTVIPDVAVGNGKDPAATELLERMAPYGKVTPLETEIAALRAEYQTRYDNLMRQHLAIADQALTGDEIDLLNSYRTCKKLIAEKYESRITTLEQNAIKTAEDLQKKAALIRELFPEA